MFRSSTANHWGRRAAYGAKSQDADVDAALVGYAHDYPVSATRSRSLKLSLLSKFSLLSMALMLLTGALLGWNLTRHSEQQALDQYRSGVCSLVLPVVGGHLTQSILASGASGEDYRRIEMALANLGGSGLVGVRIWNAQGMIVYSDQPKEVGGRFELTADLSESLDGLTSARILPFDGKANRDERGYGQLMQVHVPLHLAGDDQIKAVFEGFYDIDELRESIDSTNGFLWASTVGGFLFLYVSLFTIVRTASQEITRRNAENNHLLNDVRRSNIELALAYDVTLEGWSRALDLRDKETEGHTQRVTEMTVRLARVMGVGEADLVQIQRGALLHDIGKMGIPDSILLKPGPLTDEEWEIMKRHPVYAYELLSPIAFLRGALEIPYCHHEKWDGSGYPRGLKGEQIPLSARIFAIVDVWDALRSDRPYRGAWGEEKVREHIRTLSGTHFDPRVVKAFLEQMP